MIKLRKIVNEYSINGEKDTILTYPTSDSTIGYVMFTFGAKAPIDGDYILNLKNDGWFRRPEDKRGAGYGLAIRDIQIDKNNPNRNFLESKFNVYKCKVKFLPSTEDEDNPARYDRGTGWLWVNKRFTIDEVEKYIKYNMNKWQP